MIGATQVRPSGVKPMDIFRCLRHRIHDRFPAGHSRSTGPYKVKRDRDEIVSLALSNSRASATDWRNRIIQLHKHNHRDAEPVAVSQYNPSASLYSMDSARSSVDSGISVIANRNPR